jgi:hypothetical protein
MLHSLFICPIWLRVYLRQFRQMIVRFGDSVDHDGRTGGLPQQVEERAGAAYLERPQKPFGRIRFPAMKVGIASTLSGRNCRQSDSRIPYSTCA